MIVWLLIKNQSRVYVIMIENKKNKTSWLIISLVVNS